jgi:hypothetical protein
MIKIAMMTIFRSVRFLFTFYLYAHKARMQFSKVRVQVSIRLFTCKNSSLIFATSWNDPLTYNDGQS